MIVLGIFPQTGDTTAPYGKYWCGHHGCCLGCMVEVSYSTTCMLMVSVEMDYMCTYHELHVTYQTGRPTLCYMYSTARLVWAWPDFVWASSLNLFSAPTCILWHWLVLWWVWPRSLNHIFLNQSRIVLPYQHFAIMKVCTLCVLGERFDASQWHFDKSLPIVPGRATNQQIRGISFYKLWCTYDYECHPV